MARTMRAQIAVGADTAFPRDRICLTPHFLDSTDGNFQALANDLADKFNVYFTSSKEVSVKVYDALVPKPNPPAATAIRSVGLTPDSGANRETALCLSYFAGQNVKRRRGRLYIPAAWLSTGALPSRPTSTHRGALVQFVNIFATSGPASVQWALFSRRDHQAFAVTDWWVDDEWDTQRRRGLRPTTRTTGTTNA